jgi:hypothetical protein
MSQAAVGDQRRVPGAAIRLIVPVALIAIFPFAAWGLQIQAFHPLYPTHPPTGHAQPVRPPAAIKPVNALAGRKLTPKERKRMAATMNRRAANGKAPQAKKSVR